MAAYYKLVLGLPNAGTFEFGVQGEFYPRLVPIYPSSFSVASIALNVEWSFRDLALLPGATDTWDNVPGFIAAVKTATSAKIVRVADNHTVWEIGPNTNFALFRFVEARGVTYDRKPALSWREVSAWDIGVSAVLPIPDGQNVLDFEQTIQKSYRNGLRTLTWITSFSCPPNQDAEALGKALFALTPAIVGSDHAFQTGNTAGGGGVDYVGTGGDSRINKPPLRGVVTSTARQIGAPFGGVTSIGGSPDDARLTITTTKAADGTTEIQTQATAAGPNALAWVRQQRPVTYLEEKIVEEPTGNLYTGTWTEAPSSTVSQTSSVTVTITGGFPELEFRPIASGFDPVLFEGALQPFEARVQVEVTRRGDNLTQTDIMFPPVLGDPWVLDRNASWETEPELVENAASASMIKWRRRALLVYRSASAPTKPIRDTVADTFGAKQTLASYFMRASRTTT